MEKISKLRLPLLRWRLHLTQMTHTFRRDTTQLSTSYQLPVTTYPTSSHHSDSQIFRLTPQSPISAVDRKPVLCWRASCSKSHICYCLMNQLTTLTSKCWSGLKTGSTAFKARH